MCFYGSMHHRNLPYISGPVDEGKCPTAGAAGNIFSLQNECTLQETVFTTFCRRPAGPRLDHLCLSHNDLSQLSPQLFVEVCKLDISHNEASALEDL